MRASEFIFRRQGYPWLATNLDVKQDRRRVAAGEAYEVSYFAQKHGISKAQPEKIIKQARGSRERANALAERAA